MSLVKKKKKKQSWQILDVTKFHIHSLRSRDGLEGPNMAHTFTPRTTGAREHKATAMTSDLSFSAWHLQDGSQLQGDSPAAGF